MMRRLDIFLRCLAIILLGLLPLTEAVAGNCTLVSKICIDGPSTRVISGFTITEPCWRYQSTYSCTSPSVTAGNCGQYATNPLCGQTYSKCISTNSNGACVSWAVTYSCQTSPPQSFTQANCGGQPVCLDGSCVDQSYTPDGNFNQAVTVMEAVREAGIYLDPNSLTIFNGVPSTCADKYFGLNNCCAATSAGSASMTDYAIMSAAGSAVKTTAAYASAYMYDALYQSDAPSLLMDSLGSMATSYGSFGAFGLTLDIGPTVGAAGSAIAVPAGSTVIASGPGYALMFNPTTLVIAVVIIVVMNVLMQCSSSDANTAMRKSANLCHYVGSYCSQKIGLTGTCVSTTNSYCCFNSVLSKVINEQGRPQLGMGWGSAQSPSCQGFTVSQLQSLDFSKMDFSQFYAAIAPNMPNTAALTQAIQSQITTSTQGYYPSAQSQSAPAP